MNKNTNFSSEIRKLLGFYVYRLIDPRNGETFYVGKGTDNRVFHHINAFDQINEKVKEDDALSLKLERIRDIRNANLEVVHVIHRHGMKEKVALAVEAALIDAFPGITNEKAGVGSDDYGPMHVDEIITSYGAEEAQITGEHKILFVSINISNTKRLIYDAARYAWKVDIARAEKADLVLAVAQKIIKGVFIPEKWLPATQKNFPKLFDPNSKDRFGFIEREADTKLRSQYLNKRVPEKHYFTGNAIRYTYK